MSVKRKLTPVAFTQVSIEDAFWLPKIEINRTQTIPAEYKMCEDTGRIAAFDLKWKQGDSNPPHIFWDSDVAKWIEAASYSLATHVDERLDALLDSVIGRIALAQQPDGYLNTHYILVEPAARWSNLRDCHELYCAGHLIEAAVAHFKATGKRSLLDIMCRYVDCIDRVFGPEKGKLRGYCGHEEIELALVKLYRVTSEKRYLLLAEYFVNERGQTPHYFDLEALIRGDDPAKFWAHSYSYMQALIPVRDQVEVTGHAVRAMYLYSAMADLANELGDVALLQACERLWNDICLKRMYLTGGIGPSRSNEGFTTHYDLPDMAAYAETCAAVGLVFWNHRLLQFDGNGKYADIMEQALYNGTISGVSLDGTRFFYENPLASLGNHHRKGWFDCACCPPNIARMIASVGEYIYSQGDHDIWVHLYAQCSASVELSGNRISVEQKTDYPWDGVISLSIKPTDPIEFVMHMRIPGWCQSHQVFVNKVLLDPKPVMLDGYVAIQRTWRAGDEVTLILDMPVSLKIANPQAQLMTGRVAVQRGPVVYCLEGVDHNDVALNDIVLNTQAGFTITDAPDLLGGVTIISGTGYIRHEPQWRDELYQNLNYKTNIPNIPLTFVPYFAWDNRVAGEMRVWLRTL